MTKRSVQRKPPATNVPTPAVPDLAELLTAVESECNRAADIALTTSRVITGAEQGLTDAELVYSAALEHVARRLEDVADRALKARTGGAA